MSLIPILLRRAGGGASSGNKGGLGQEREAGGSIHGERGTTAQGLSRGHAARQWLCLLLSLSVRFLLVSSFLHEDLVITFVILLPGALLIVDT